MSETSHPLIEKFTNNRILIIDDNDNIHLDFKKILSSNIRDNYELEQLEAVIFDKKAELTSDKPQIKVEYNIDHALSGEEGIQRVVRAAQRQRPYALVFVDIRMPPGIDGIQVSRRIWEIDDRTEIVLCTAFSDYSWENIVTVLGSLEHLLFLKKPFNSVEVKQMCYALLYKWNTTQSQQQKIRELEQRLAQTGKQSSDQ